MQHWVAKWHTSIRTTESTQPLLQHPTALLKRCCTSVAWQQTPHEHPVEKSTVYSFYVAKLSQKLLIGFPVDAFSSVNWTTYLIYTMKSSHLDTTVWLSWSLCVNESYELSVVQLPGKRAELGAGTASPALPPSVKCWLRVPLWCVLLSGAWASLIRCSWCCMPSDWKTSYGSYITPKRRLAAQPSKPLLNTDSLLQEWLQSTKHS